MGINMKNVEGYHDPTPHKALSNITLHKYQYKNVQKLSNTMYNVV